ncbi:hypothetical protein C4D60_Mb11t02440 [Musa balbisiana]|uniref:HMA domain-containing protein n=1 Tax=Musa balbisiana TaxID=52838 RepID=A0A4S8J167_MUSBA|nr:hypothetical protein C4D60_Mb11t02440 [Musa balbisiana]
MAASLATALHSFLSTIYPFRYQRSHPKSLMREFWVYSLDSVSLMTVELKVRMCCTGCERVVKQALLKLRGVDSVEVDLELEKVTVTGYVDRNKVLKEVRRSGKKAEFWPNPDLPLHFTTAKDYFHDEESFRDSYNYWKHGYNGDKHGRLPVTHRGEDAVSNMFNDDDVNACSVM